MSGYLEVKYPFKSNLVLNPFKTWKRQWCILRPSPTSLGGGSLAVYCSEAGAVAGCIQLPAECSVRRAKSRTRPHAFAVFSPQEARKPRVLLAAHSSNDAQHWIDKIRALLSGNKFLGTETLLKDSYSIAVSETALSVKCGLGDSDGVLTLSSKGLTVTLQGHDKTSTFIQWKHISDVSGDSRSCVLSVDSRFPHGAGELKLAGAGGELVAALKQSLKESRATMCARALSKSDGDLRSPARGHVTPDTDIDIRRSSWYSGPSEVSLDDTDLVISKESACIPGGVLSRCAGAGDLAPPGAGAAARSTLVTHTTHSSLASFDDSMSDRRSLLSIASGIYEEIPDVPPDTDTVDGPQHDRRVALDVEPTYESVAECVYATMRRTGKRCPPPPLPPRLPFGATKLGESWNSRMNKPGADVSNVTRHSSLGSIPRCCSVSSGTSTKSEDYNTKSQDYGTKSGDYGTKSEDYKTKTLPKLEKSRQAFNAFRKRLKSDSRIATSPKSETKENKDTDTSKATDTKKKKFDFAPTRDIFRSFKVGKKMKGLKIVSGNLSKIGETKSCEFLDETEHVTANRCSKSVECLEGSQEFDDDIDGPDLSIEYSDEVVASLSLPQDIVDLILRGREQLAEIRLKQRQMAEDDYMPMSPIVVPPTPIEQHYIVMSPRTKLT